MAIQFGGLATGLDTNRMISQLVSLERRPIARLEQRRRDINTEITNIGLLSGEMKKLSDTLEEMASASDVMAFSAQSSDEDAVTALATGAAQQGVFSLRVDQLASAARVRSDAFASKDDLFGEGTLSIGVFEEDSVDITVEATDTLTDVRDKINSATDLVSAALIDSGNGVYLSISSNKEGHTIGGAAADALILDHQPSAGAAQNFQTIQAASNAQFELDGLAIEQSSNTVDSVLEGLTFELHAETTGNIELSVDPDTEGMIEKIETFVDQYNGVIDALNKNSPERAESRERGLTDMRDVLITTVATGAEDVSNLASIGVEASRSTGKLSIDRAALEEALASNPQAVASLFGAETDGISARLTETLERYTDSNDGYLDLARESLSSRRDALEGQIDRKELSVERYEARLQRQFTQLEVLTVELQDIQARFASITSLYTTY